MDRDETGKDGVLIVNGEEYSFTNCSYSLTWGETGSDYNDTREVHHRKTNKDSDGSFDFEGSQEELRAAIMNDNGEQYDDIRLQVEGSEGGDRFTGVTITSLGREYPGGDVTTQSVEWVANHHRPIDLGV